MKVGVSPGVIVIAALLGLLWLYWAARLVTYGIAKSWLQFFIRKKKENTNATE